MLTFYCLVMHSFLIISQYRMTSALLSEHAHSGISPYLERSISEAELMAAFSFFFLFMCSSATLPSQREIRKLYTVTFCHHS